MALLLVYLLPFFVGAWIGIAAKTRFWLALVVGIALASPATATFLPGLIASRPDSIWFTAIPALGAGLACGAVLVMGRMVLEWFSTRPRKV